MDERDMMVIISILGLNVIAFIILRYKTYKTYEKYERQIKTNLGICTMNLTVTVIFLLLIILTRMNII